MKLFSAEIKRGDIVVERVSGFGISCRRVGFPGGGFGRPGSVLSAGYDGGELNCR